MGKALSKYDLSTDSNSDDKTKLSKMEEMDRNLNLKRSHEEQSDPGPSVKRSSRLEDDDEEEMEEQQQNDENGDETVEREELEEQQIDMEEEEEDDEDEEEEEDELPEGDKHGICKWISDSLWKQEMNVEKNLNQFLATRNVELRKENATMKAKMVGLKMRKRYQSPSVIEKFGDNIGQKQLQYNDEVLEVESVQGGLGKSGEDQRLAKRDGHE